LPYHSEGINKNKKIKEARKKPIPTLLMALIPDEEIRKICEKTNGKNIGDLPTRI